MNKDRARPETDPRNSRLIFFRQLGLFSVSLDVVIWNRIVLWAMPCLFVRSMEASSQCFLPVPYLALVFKWCWKCLQVTPNNCNTENTRISLFGFIQFQVCLFWVISGVLCGREEGKRQFHYSLFLKTFKYCFLESSVLWRILHCFLHYAFCLFSFYVGKNAKKYANRYSSHLILDISGRKFTSLQSESCFNTWRLLTWNRNDIFWDKWYVYIFYEWANRVRL